MSPNEIRNLLPSVDDFNTEMEHLQMQILVEIAAQLAELNHNFKLVNK